MVVLQASSLSWHSMFQQFFLQIALDKEDDAAGRTSGKK
jgi:hypothetical protein